MTVKELIAALKTYEPDIPVVTLDVYGEHVIVTREDVGPVEDIRVATRKIKRALEIR